MEFAVILNQEARELEAAGVDIISSTSRPSMSSSTRSTTGVLPPSSVRSKGSSARPPSTSATATASRPIPTGSRPWGRSGVSTKSRFLLQTSTLDIISLECHNSHVPIDLIELVRGKKVMVGAIDVASNTIETPEEVAATLRKALRFVDADKLYPSTNCGMAPLARDVARGKLKALSAGADIIRPELAAR